MITRDLFFILFFGLLNLFCLSNVTIYAQDLTDADQIALKVFNRDNGRDSVSTIEMYLVDKMGFKRKRLLQVYTKDYGELMKTFIRFLKPADIEGTGFLSLENKSGNDTQYLYLPELGRSRRIVSSQQNLRFVNTDFTYEDMQRRKPELDIHRFIGYEELEGYQCYVIEYIPKDKDSSQYSKTVQWIDKDSFIPIRVDFYNKKNKLIKRLSVKQLKKIEGIWTAVDMIMEDFLERHKTRLFLTEVIYNQELNDDIFTVDNLEDY